MPGQSKRCDEKLNKCKFQFQFHNFYFQSIEITFENSGQTQKTEFSVAEEFAMIVM